MLRYWINKKKLVPAHPHAQKCHGYMQADAYACMLDTHGIQKASVFAFSASATSPILESEVKDIPATTLPLSERMDGFMFDPYDPGVREDFDEEVADTSLNPLRQIETPVRIIHAEDDPYANPENVRGLADQFPNARLFLVPDGGHPLLAHSVEVSAQIIQFLSSRVGMPNTGHGLHWPVISIGFPSGSSSIKQ